MRKKKTFLKQNIEELVNQRLENDLCDEFLLEKNKKDKHKHDSKRNGMMIVSLLNISF